MTNDHDDDDDVVDGWDVHNLTTRCFELVVCVCCVRWLRVVELK